MILINKYEYDKYINKTFGKLTISNIFLKDHCAIAKCMCSCGNEIEKRLYDILDGKITTCGKCDSKLLLHKTFGNLTVYETYYKDGLLWCKCNCSCGNQIDVSASNLKRGNSKSCKKCDSFLLLNKKFGDLTVIETFYKKDKSFSQKLWCKCECICGNTINIRANALKHRKTKNCGECNKRLLIGKQFGELTVLDTYYKKASNGKRELWCQCICSCGKEINVRSRSIIRKDNPQISCGCIKISKGQKNIEDWLTAHNITFNKEETFNKNDELRTDKYNYLRFDIFIPCKNLIIEFDGIQHYYPIPMWGGEDALLKTQQHDSLKNAWANKHGIKLIRFNYKQTKKEIEEKLKSLLS